MANNAQTSNGRNLVEAVENGHLHLRWLSESGLDAIERQLTKLGKTPSEIFQHDATKQLKPTRAKRIYSWNTSYRDQSGAVRTSNNKGGLNEFRWLHTKSSGGVGKGSRLTQPELDRIFDGQGYKRPDNLEPGEITATHLPNGKYIEITRQQ